jgi:uncharacterized protein with HEPN domain
MPPTVEDRYRDIVEAIAEIEGMWSGKTFSEFTASRPLQLATERLLEIVCEASRKLPDAVKRDEPAIAWRKIVDFGNILRHAYHTTKPDIVWSIVVDDLSALKAFAEEKLRPVRR